MLSGYRLSLIFRKHKISNGFILRRNFVNIIIRILNIKVQVKGDIPDYPCLYVINHRNLIDPVIIAQIVDVYFLSKAEVKSYPFLGKGAEMTGVIYVIREEKSSRMAARMTLRKTMKEGLNVAVYPEGTTGTEELTINFHKGAFEEAAMQKVPVVPIAMEYKKKSDLWIQPSLMKQFLIQFGKKETEVKVEIHPPLTSDNGQYLMEQSKNIIDESLRNMHKGWNEVFG